MARGAELGQQVMARPHEHWDGALQTVAPSQARASAAARTLRQASVGAASSRRSGPASSRLRGRLLAEATPSQLRAALPAPPLPGQ